MPVTPLFAAMFALIYIYLSLMVIKIRINDRVVLGTAENKELEKAVRIHANFVEYVPFAIILFWFVENFTHSPMWVVWMGCILLVARIAHVIGMKNPKGRMIFRQLGTVMTHIVILVSSIKLLWWYLPVSV